MPLQLPELDDRNFEQLLEEAKRRIPTFTPEWTNFGGDSDPGITLVQLFAFLTDTLLYRANRIPELNRLKFLQLLRVPLQPAAAANGIITIAYDRGPLVALPIDRGVVVSAGNVDFLTSDGVNILPVEAQIYYKNPILEADPRYQNFVERYEAIRLAEELTLSTGSSTSSSVQLAFYETTRLTMPSLGNPKPVLDLATTQDNAIYIALLAPQNADLEEVRRILADQTLSIGVAPDQGGDIKPLQPVQLASRPVQSVRILYEMPANVTENAVDAQYIQLTPMVNTDVTEAIGVVQVKLPGVNDLKTWSFTDPLAEGIGDFPPRLEDDQLRDRLVTWIRLRVVKSDTINVASTVPTLRLTWVGINAARVHQAVPMVNELLGLGFGEPDQSFTLANMPVLPQSISIMVQDTNTNTMTLWRLTDDLLAAKRDDQVFALDSEAGHIRFGDGLRGARPQGRILASYEYGGGRQGNISIGGISISRDPHLQGGYKISNPIPTSGGDSGETIEEGERRIPLVLRNHDRLVTMADFKDIATQTSGVDLGRVEVLPLFRPTKPPLENAPGIVTLMVVPRFDAINSYWPTPDRLFLRRVCDHLDSRRLVTTEIYVRGPEYVPVYISVGIQVQGGYSPDIVRETVRIRLSGYLSALPLGGPEGLGWPLKKRLIQKDLEAVVTRVAGVEFVNELKLGVATPGEVTDANLVGLQLPMIVGLSVTEGEPEQLTSLVGQINQPDAQTKIVPVPVSRKTC
ncbi:putative baseplate assembly protein [Nitrosomonas ureae]|uniref:Putative baseplate assembly protein n=1 Tax=Nitrosomonas ureae TaxID=44577 RepID=A0A1H9D0T5_9PROT|nr:putative baseplate assembly protein [Nitrosomonas ureae]SEQ07112.1 putative baseplate assembly protein [Nitrosomonas ureae]